MKKKVNHNPDFDRLKDWDEAFPRLRAYPTAQQLIDSGYCRIKASGDVEDCIARLDKKDWLDSVHVEHPGSSGWGLPECANIYRSRLAAGYRNVPAKLLHKLTWSDNPNAPTEFKYHWRYPGKQVAEEPEPEPAPPAEAVAAPAPKPEPDPNHKSAMTHVMPTEYELVELPDGTSVSLPHEAVEHPFAALAAMAEGRMLTPEQPQASAPAQDQEETEMNLPAVEPAKDIALEPVAMKVVVVTFDDTGEQEYFYFAPESAKPGDFAVVYAKMAKDTGAKFAIGRIERDTPDLDGKARSAILGVFNEDFATRVQAKMDRLTMVKARLQRKKQQYEERRIFELIAKEDPETRELLDMLKRLEG